jgi:hypothetical protein
MKILDLDFRFTENYYELYALGDFRIVLEKQLAAVIINEQERFEIELGKQKWDEIELDQIRQAMNDRVYELLPRYFRSPFLVTLWSIVETSITEVAKYLQIKKNKKLSLKDIKGKNFIDQSDKYYRHILEFTLFQNTNILNQLDMLRILRNTIAHCNGRIDAIKENDLIKIKTFRQSYQGIDIYSNSIIFSDNFLKETYDVIKSGIFDLLDRAKTEFPDDNYFMK